MVLPAGRPQRPPEKDPKPWTRSLPHIILLDPMRAHKYGHPESGRPGQGAPHALPRVHQRRGHWRMLRHERFTRDPEGKPRRVFVRQAWIRERQWIHEGSRYRVLEPIEQGERW